MPRAQILALKDALEQAHRALTDPDMDEGERNAIVHFVQMHWLLLDRSLAEAA